MTSILDTKEEKVARPYQLRLFDHAVKKNSIIYLPTGSGKTYIAIMIIRHFSKNYMLPINEGGKRCVVLSNTVALARQLVNEIALATNFKVALFIGDMNVDNWPQEKWESEINSNQVLVGTSQVFVDMVSHKYLAISDLSCVIIDECHHATKSHPMHQFLSLSMHAPQKELPRLVGLTGILLKSSKKCDILKPLQDLEAVFRGNIITVQNLDELHNVLIYSTAPKESLLKYTNISPVFDVDSAVRRIISESMEEIKVWNFGEKVQKFSKNLQSLQEPNKIKQVTSLMTDFLYQMDDMGVYAASIAIMGLIVQFEVNKRNAETFLLKNMYRYLVTQCELVRHILVKKLRTFCDDPDDEDTDEADVILNFSKPKLQALISYFIREFSTKKATDISCLLFVQRRYTAKCLCFVLKNFAAVYKGLSHITPEFMVGRNAGMIYSIDTVLETKWNRQAIESFRRKECNLIVCSSVLEEGIDVQACNYVISFDPIKQFGSYVQMKGRARSVDSTFLVLCQTDDAAKVAQQINSYKEIDKKLKEYLLTRTIDREVPDKSCTEEQFSKEIKPFISPSGAILTAEAALMLLHRYCQTLPHDSFTNLNPIWAVISSVPKQIQVSMELPLQSTVKEIICSDVVKSFKEAKISAAFKACLKLYQNGELNEKLLPVTRKQIVENVSDIYFSKWKDLANYECADEGTKKNLQIYDVFWPKETSPSMPLPNQCSYVYRITTVPNFTMDEANFEIYDMLSSKESYAIISSNKLPAFAPMPMYVTQGQLTVEVCKTPLEVTIRDGDEMNMLKKFTKMIFHDIRRFWQDFLALSDGNKPNSFLIAPTTCSGVIDWDLIREFQRMSKVREPSETERARKIYRPEDYVGNVVCTWYNECEDGPRYTVTKILYDLTPLSPFPDENEGSRKNPYTFADYVESKYGKRVMQKNQFMIEARPINKRTRFFVNITEKPGETKKKKRTNKIVLIPEMCHNFNFPGNLWFKALLLPSILHRLHYLQCAEWLRIDINKFLGIPSPPDYSPAPLQIDFSLARVQNADEFETPRSLLPALDNMRRDEFTKPSHALVDVEQGNWKTHYEPIDVFRNMNSLYPIEIDYYYMFANNLLQDMENLSLENVTEQQVSTCNLTPYKPKMEPQYDQGIKRIKFSTGDSTYRLQLLENTKRELSTAEQYEFLAAITTAAANDVFDMERFEVLGDSFLKFSVSLLLMTKHPTWNEGFLTATKSKIVSNRNFLYCMRSKYNCSFIRTSNFDAKDEWVPPMAAIPSNVQDAIEQKLISLNSITRIHLTDNEKESGLCSESTLAELLQSMSISDESDDAFNVFQFKQAVRDKVMADCLEALLGVCVKNYGVEMSFKMLNYFGIYKDTSDDLLSKLLKTRMVNPRVKTTISQKEIDSYLPNYQFLEESLKYEFKDRAYLLQALTHPSYPTNRLTGCYQQLEFIGDAVLDFLVSSFIYERCTHMTPGEITDLRSALVNNITLGCICIRNRFHQFMLYESPALSDSIRKFVEFQNVQDHRVTDQVRILLEETSSSESFNMSQNIDVPKALGDVVEAIIGAVFIDSGNDLKRTWDVIYGLLNIEIHDFVKNVPIDPVRQLCEYRGANPSFNLYHVETDVVMIQCTFHCRDLVKTVIGCGGNQVMAKKAASKMALQILRES